MEGATTLQIIILHSDNLLGALCKPPFCLNLLAGITEQCEIHPNVILYNLSDPEQRPPNTPQKE